MNPIILEIEAFAQYLKRKRFEISDEELLDLYNKGETEKLYYYLMKRPFKRLMQKTILDDQNLDMIQAFCYKWFFEESLHPDLVRSPLFILDLAMPKTTFQEKFQIVLAKDKSKRDVLKIYEQHHKLCKKAANIIKSV